MSDVRSKYRNLFFTRGQDEPDASIYRGRNQRLFQHGLSAAPQNTKYHRNVAPSRWD
jgi:hypothetical protein